jgi:hypothetical protein
MKMDLRDIAGSFGYLAIAFILGLFANLLLRKLSGILLPDAPEEHGSRAPTNT